MVCPIPFFLFVNDTVLGCSGSKFILFEDGSSVFISDKISTCLISCTNHMLSSVETWLIRNRLRLNESGTQYVVFYRKQRENPWSNNVYLGGFKKKMSEKCEIFGSSCWWSPNMTSSS